MENVIKTDDHATVVVVFTKEDTFSQSNRQLLKRFGGCVTTEEYGGTFMILSNNFTVLQDFNVNPDFMRTDAIRLGNISYEGYTEIVDL